MCGQVVKHLPLSQATVSEHLRVLKEAGLIIGTVNGQRSCYCIDPQAIALLREKTQALFGKLESCC